MLHKEKNALFRDFFTLWGNIDPYTNRGRPKEAHPILQISFTAEANLIYISLDFNYKRILPLISPPNGRWRVEAPATKLRCLHRKVANHSGRGKEYARQEKTKRFGQ